VHAVRRLPDPMCDGAKLLRIRSVRLMDGRRCDNAFGIFSVCRRRRRDVCKPITARILQHVTAPTNQRRRRRVCLHLDRVHFPAVSCRLSA